MLSRGCLNMTLHVFTLWNYGENSNLRTLWECIYWIFFAILHCIQVWLLSKRLPSEAWREYRFWSQLRRQIDFSRNIHEKQCRTTTVFPFAILNTKSKNNKIHLWGQEYALQHGGQYRSYYFVENQNASTSLFINAFPLIFQVYENFYVPSSINFWHQLDSNQETLLFQLTV